MNFPSNSDASMEGDGNDDGRLQGDIQDADAIFQDSDQEPHSDYSHSDLDSPSEPEDDPGADPEDKAKTPYLLLDIGVGSGLCASVLEEHCHHWVGVDISSSMLAVARNRQNDKELCAGDLILADVGDGVSFRPGVFDGAISISALQWLCNADKHDHCPRTRLTRLFTSLYACLRHGARAVFQFYPENRHQIDMILMASLDVGFTGGLVIDYPNSSKRKKYFLCLIAGGGASLPQPLTDHAAPLKRKRANVIVNSESTQRDPSSRKRQKSARSKNVKDRNWVLRKKESMRKRGHTNVPMDTKYTARKRRPCF